MEEEKNIFVIDHLINEGVIQNMEGKKLSRMMSSHNKGMRDIANYIILDKWKMVYPTSSITTKSRIFKEKHEK